MQARPFRDCIHTPRVKERAAPEPDELPYMRPPTPQQHRALAVALALSLMALLGACRKEPKHTPPAPPPAMPARSSALPLQAILPRGVTAAAWLDLAAVRRDPRLQRVWQEVGMPGGASREGGRERLMSQASELVVAWYGMDGSRPLRLLRGTFVPALEADGEGSGHKPTADWRVWSPTEDLLVAGDPELVLQSGARIRVAQPGTDEAWRAAVAGPPAVARAVFVADPAHAIWLATQVDYKEITDRAADIARIEASASLGLGLDLVVTVVPTQPALGARAAELVTALLAVARGLVEQAEGSAGSGEPGLIAGLLSSVRVAPPTAEGSVLLSLEVSGTTLDRLVQGLLSAPAEALPAPAPTPAVKP